MCGRFISTPFDCLVFQRETDLDGNLPSIDLAVFDRATRIDDNKPSHVFDRLGRTCDSVLDRILHRRRVYQRLLLYFSVAAVMA